MKEPGLSDRKDITCLLLTAVWYHKKVWVHLAFIVLILLGFHFGLRTALSKKNLSSSRRNAFCSSEDLSQDHFGRRDQPQLTAGHNNINNSSKNLRETLCTGFSKHTQFKKFIWVTTDGLPVGYSTKILNHYKAIYTSFFTGQLPTNYQNEMIKSEHLIETMSRAHFKMHYVGPEFPVLSLFEESKRSLLFTDGITNTEEIETIHGPANGKWSACKVFNSPQEEALDAEESIPRPHPYFFGNTERKETLYKFLGGLKDRGASLFAYSSLLDSYQHNGALIEECSWPRLLKRVNADLTLFKEFIDENPDYLLILSTDHGQNQRKPDFILHGLPKDGNEGYLLFYNPLLFPQDNPKDTNALTHKTIDVVDVAPTVAGYFEGVDIPLLSIGIARNQYGETAQALNFEKIIKRNLLQLIESAKERGHSLPSSIQPSQVKSMSMAESATAAEEIKKLLYQPMFISFLSFMYFIGITLASLLLLLKINNLDILAKYAASKNQLIGVIVMLVVVYWSVYVNILFVHPDWKPVYRSGVIYLLTSVTLSGLMWWILKDAGVEMEQDARAVQGKILSTEAVNWMVLLGAYYISTFTFQQESTSLKQLMGYILDLALIFSSRWIQLKLNTHLNTSTSYSPAATAVPSSPSLTSLSSLSLLNVKEKEVSKFIPAGYCYLTLLIHCYHWTKDVPEMLWIGIGFHAVGLAIYLSLLILVLMAVVCLVYGDYLHSSLCFIVSLTGLMWYLHTNSITMKILVLVLNFQYVNGVIPLSQFFYQQISGKTSIQWNNVKSMIGFQAITVYALNISFFTYLSFGTVDLDMNADYGVMGVTKVDHFPLFNAFLIGVGNFGLLLYLVFYMWLNAIVLVFSKATSQKKEPQSKTLNWMTGELFGLILLINFISTSLGLVLLERSYILKHAEQECMGLVIVLGALALVYALILLLTDFTPGTDLTKERRKLSGRSSINDV